VIGFVILDEIIITLTMPIIETDIAINPVTIVRSSSEVLPTSIKETGFSYTRIQSNVGSFSYTK